MTFSKDDGSWTPRGCVSFFFWFFFSFFVSLSDFFFAASTRGRRRRRTSPFIRLINQPRPIINSHSSPSNKSPPTMSHDVPRIFSTIVLCAPVRLSADDLGPIRWYTNCPWLDMFCFFFGLRLKSKRVEVRANNHRRRRDSLAVDFGSVPSFYRVRWTGKDVTVALGKKK